MLHQAADALIGATPAPSVRRSWPYGVVMPDNAATPEGHNVRRVDGSVVFGAPVTQVIAQQACDALNQRWDEGVE